MNRFLFLYLVAAVLLLPSCVRWHLGAVIRDAAESRIGVDVEHPVDGKRYMVQRWGRDKNITDSYVYAPEVRYHQSTPWVEFDDAPGEPPHARPAVRLRPTGRVVLARVAWEREPLRGLEQKMVPGLNPLRACFREEVKELPPGARPQAMPSPLETRPFFVIRKPKAPDAKPLPAWSQEARKPLPMPKPKGATVATLGTLEHRRSMVVTVVAAPFDYAIDPVLSGLSTALFWTGAAVVGLPTGGCMSLLEWCEQQQQPAPSVGLFEGEFEGEYPDASPHNASERPQP